MASLTKLVQENQKMNGYGKSPGLKQQPRGSQEEQPSHSESRGEEVVRKKSRSRERLEDDSHAQLLNPRPVRVGVIFKDRRTNVILKHVFCEVCGQDVRQVQRDVVRIAGTNPEDGKLIKRVSDLIVQFIKETDQVTRNLDTFAQQENWNLHSSNVYREFSEVASTTFKETINWGRVVMFLGFAVSFSIYLERNIMVGATESVLQWTGQVLEEDLGGFIKANGGWEGFADYLDTALRATRRSHKKQQLSSTGSEQNDGAGPGDESRGSIWNSALAAGAVAVGAMAALTLRQAFS